LTNGYGSSSEAPACASDGASVPRRQVSPARAREVSPQRNPRVNPEYHPMVTRESIIAAARSWQPYLTGQNARP